MKVMKVKGLNSIDAQNSVSKALKTADGVEVVTVNYETGEISYDPEVCTLADSEIKKKLCDIGYDVEED